MSVEAIFKFVAATVPAIMVLGGIFLLVLGYPIDHVDMIRSGWGLIIFGGGSICFGDHCLLFRLTIDFEDGEPMKKQKTFLTLLLVLVLVIAFVYILFVWLPPTK